MPFLYLAICFVFLVIIMTKFKLNPFIALLLSAILVGILNQMPFSNILQSVTSGIGDTVGGLVLIITFGAMLGKILEVTGAAHKITEEIVQKLGTSRIKYAVLIAGFIIGLPMMYNASFLVLIPIIYALSFSSKINLIQLGIPLSASLSIAHGYLPPHPAPVVVSQMYGADMNTVFIYGLILAIPAILVAGVILPRFFKKTLATVPEKLYNPDSANTDNPPSFGISLFCATLPFILMAGAAVLKNLQNPIINFIGDPNMALLIAVLVSLVLLGLNKGHSMDKMMKELGVSASSIAMIVLIIAAGGAFKQVLQDSGSAEYILQAVEGINIHPLLLAWGLAALIRLLLGSATVATITAAGIMATMVPDSGISLELMVLATGSGSLMFSHFNDIGFWMFKEYYNVSIKKTFMIWTTMECLVGIIGLIGCFILNTCV